MLALLTVGCAGPAISEAEWERRTTLLLQERKAASQARVEGDRIAGEPASQFVNRRTAFLLGGPARVTTRISPNGHTAVVGWELQPGNHASGVGSAAAVSADGYFLTAAHAVSDTPMQVVFASRRGVDVVPARLVWQGDPKKGGPDLALIHAPARDQAYFILADAESLPLQARVWTGGFGDVRQNQSRGRLRGLGGWQTGEDGAPWRIVEHSAPLMRGDSGGPLVARDGRLIGINTEFLVQAANLLGHDHLRVYRPMAVAADLRWIESLMAKDRAKRSSRR